jgi:cytochrome c5
LLHFFKARGIAYNPPLQKLTRKGFFMAEVHVEDHESLIKTPKQLIVVVLLAFLIPIFGIVMIATFATGGLRVDRDSSAASNAAVAERLKPVGSVTIGEVAPATASTVKPVASAPVKTAATGSADAGKNLYNSVCVACHGAGIAGAPKFGDSAAWKPRIAQGRNALYNSALHGKNAMPAKGGMASAPDADIKAAVDYMVSQVK